jgi:regulator of protease activity HflC (stomatin/prohibitin superfamily)
MASRRESVSLRAALVIVVLACAALLGSCYVYKGVTVVEPGNIGLRVSRTGSTRGVQDLPTASGYCWAEPFTSYIVEFPLTTQTVVWSGNEAITFASREGSVVQASVSISYHVDPGRAGRLYTRFRTTSLDLLTHGYVRNLVRDALNETASGMTIQDIYGSGKTRLLNESLALARLRFGGDGFVIDQLSFQGALGLPEQVVAAINRSIQAIQDAEQARNRVAQVEAQARQAEAEATGVANASRTAAQAQADSVRIRAEGEEQAATIQARARLVTARATAEAWRIEDEGTAAGNRLVAPTMTAQLLRYRWIMHWSGHLPTVLGNSTPMIQLAAPPEAP